MLLRRPREPSATGRRAARVVAMAAAAVLLVLVPPAGALVAAQLAPPARLDVAGAEVTARAVLGRDTTRLLGGALVSPRHENVAGLPIGLDVDADLNRLTPRDKASRRYLTSLWENPTPAIARITGAARHQVVVWSAGGFGAGLLLVGGALALERQRRRRLAGYPPAEARLVAAHNRRLRTAVVATGVAAALVLDLRGVQVLTTRDHAVPVPTAALDGTALEGTEVTGLLADALPFLSLLRPRAQFYDTAAEHLANAVAADPALLAEPGEVTVVLAEDFEDVNGMAQVVGRTASLVDADLLALTGDLTFAGNRLETYVLDTVDYYAGDVPIYLAAGLHDTSTVLRAAAERGWHVGDGTTVEVDGLRLLLAPDPRISTVGTFGSTDVLREAGTDVDAFVGRLVERMCADHPDLVLLHDHRLGSQVAASGCARIAVLDGRSYTYVGPRQVPTQGGGTAVELTSGSAGGHVDTSFSPGVIAHPARFTILYVDPAQGTARYAVVTVEPDARVAITTPTALPAPVTGG